eukprot:1328875-Alexandrium_andersonii.AAC.1
MRGRYLRDAFMISRDRDRAEMCKCAFVCFCSAGLRAARAPGRPNSGFAREHSRATSENAMLWSL